MACRLAYEQSRFCETFHSDDAGWRTCNSCKKVWSFAAKKNKFHPSILLKPSFAFLMVFFPLQDADASRWGRERNVKEEEEEEEEEEVQK